jgi:hypothetical protein
MRHQGSIVADDSLSISLSKHLGHKRIELNSIRLVTRLLQFPQAVPMTSTVCQTHLLFVNCDVVLYRPVDRYFNQALIIFCQYGDHTCLHVYLSKAYKITSNLSSGFLLYLRIKAIIMAGIGVTFFLLYLPKFG